MRPRLPLALAGLAAAAALAGAPAAFGQETVLAEIKDLRPGALEARGFTLDRPQEVHLEAVAIERSLRFGQAADAWILAAGSRQVVWRLAEARSTRRRDFRHVDERLSLPAGLYEVYYSTLPEHGWIFEDDDDDEWWEGLVRDLTGWDDYREDVAELSLTVRGPGRPASAADLDRARDEIREAALVSLTGLAKRSREARGFRLDREVELAVYAEGELFEDGGFDYGWIVDLGTGRRVWTLDWDGSKPAGGAKKNRVARATLRLGPGRYAAVAMTDDSHQPGAWNAPPPGDPVFWGLTLTVQPEADRRAATLFPYAARPEGEPLAAVTRVRSGARDETRFTLDAPADLRVYAVGEGTRERLYDYGWIAEAGSRRKVWEMRLGGTEHAGGAQKNRLADEILHLGPGSYVVTFVTDGSHAFRDWNSDPPLDPESWGIALYPAGEGAAPPRLRPYVEAPTAGGELLASLRRVGDREHRTAAFRLDHATRLAVSALGEGGGGEMYDYGWIEHTGTGRVVWEMTYRMTDPAGGADKNRAYAGTILLDPGEYVLHYKTDGSHSYGDWNADPPADGDAWGVEVRRVGEG
jgi:hypothetical protein